MTTTLAIVLEILRAAAAHIPEFAEWLELVTRDRDDPISLHVHDVLPIRSASRAVAEDLAR